MITQYFRSQRDTRWAVSVGIPMNFDYVVVIDGEAVGNALNV